MKSKLNTILLFLMSSRLVERMLKDWFHFYASLKPMGKIFLKNPINMIYKGWNPSPSMIASEAYP